MPADAASSSSPSATEPTDTPAAEPTTTTSSLISHLKAPEVVLMTGGLVLFLVLLYVMEASPDEGFLNPLLVATAGVILLWPLRTVRAARALMLAGGFLLLLWFMAKISAILIPFAVVYLLAYLLDPAVQFLRKRYGIRRWLSSLMVSLLVVGTLAAFILILAPNVASQVQSLTERLLSALRGWQLWLETTPVLDNLEAAGLIDKQEAVSQLTAFVQTQAGQLPDALRQLLQSLGSLLGLITTLALVPVILFYTLKDYPYLKRGLIELFPTLEGRRDYLIDAGSIVGNYLRGQLIISAIAAVNVSFWLLIGGVPFWLLIGLLAGLLNFIPNLGAIITLVIGVFIAFVFGGWVKALIVIIVLLGQGFLEQSVLTPNILSHQVGLHPVLILLSLLAFGSFLGIFGLLIAVPVTAILVTAYKAFREELTLELNEYGRGTIESDS
jgi:predicted PurR-regulated permease PerM